MASLTKPKNEEFWMPEIEALLAEEGLTSFDDAETSVVDNDEEGTHTYVLVRKQH